MLHEVWNDESGVTESVVGRLVDRPGKTVTFEYLHLPLNGPVHGRTGGWVHPQIRTTKARTSPDIAQHTRFGAKQGRSCSSGLVAGTHPRQTQWRAADVSVESPKSARSIRGLAPTSASGPSRLR